MTNRLEISLALAKQSFSIIRKNKLFTVFPLMSSALIIAAIYLLLHPITQIEKHAIQTSYVSVWQYVILLASVCIFFLFTHLITITFNTALTTCVMNYINDKPCHIGLGFKRAFKRLPTLTLWMLVMANLGVCVRLIEYWYDNWKKLAIAQNFFAGLQWLAATYLVIPVLAAEDVGTFEAIKRSSHLIKKKWGESSGARISITPALVAARIVALLPTIVAYFYGSKSALIAGISISVALLLIISIIHSTTQVILSGALYLYAANNKNLDDYFDNKMLKLAFIKPKAQKD